MDLAKLPLWDSVSIRQKKLKNLFLKLFGVLKPNMKTQIQAKSTI